MKLRVDRDHVVAAVCLKPVTGIEKERHIGALDFADELADRLTQSRQVELAAGDHHERWRHSGDW